MFCLSFQDDIYKKLVQVVIIDIKHIVNFYITEKKQQNSTVISVQIKSLVNFFYSFKKHKNFLSWSIINFVVRPDGNRCPAGRREFWMLLLTLHLPLHPSHTGLHPLGKRCVCALPSVCSKMLLIFKLYGRAHDSAEEEQYVVSGNIKLVYADDSLDSADNAIVVKFLFLFSSLYLLRKCNKICIKILIILINNVSSYENVCYVDNI